MKGIATGALTLALVLAGACERSHTRNSSGSNWLRCDTLADCSSAEDAVACDEHGYCVDAEGNRITLTSDAGGRAEDAGGADDAGGPPPPDPDACVWGVDALLQEVGSAARGRVACGLFNSADTERIVTAMVCFENAVEASRAAELTINRCIDCQIPTTYVATAGGELFAILLEDDSFGDGQRHARVESCDAIIWDAESGDAASGDVRCVNPVERYDCREDSFDAPVVMPDLQPVTPLKIADVPAPEGAAIVPLHLYVSNQSFDNALVEIDVYINGTRVVTGDFPVEGQHSWYDFDIEVPAGTLTVRAFSANGNADLGQQIDVPAERWAVLDYWFYPGEPEAEHFTLSVQDTPVAFQ